MEEKEKIKSVTVVNETTELPMSSIQSYIRIINGVQVILDRDLAFLYGVETGNLNKAVKRNIDRFPEDFMFQAHKGRHELDIPKWNIKLGRHEKTPIRFYRKWNSNVKFGTSFQNCRRSQHSDNEGIYCHASISHCKCNSVSTS